MTETRRPPTRLAAAGALLALGAWLAASALFAFGREGTQAAALNSLGLLLAVLLDLAAFLVSVLALLDGDRTRYAYGGLLASLALPLLAPAGLILLALL